MTTPTGKQQSEEQATRNGVTALEQAFAGVQRCRQDVDNMKNTLSSGYAGEGLLQRGDAIPCRLFL